MEIFNKIKNYRQLEEKQRQKSYCLAQEINEVKSKLTR